MAGRAGPSPDRSADRNPNRNSGPGPDPNLRLTAQHIAMSLYGLQVRVFMCVFMVTCVYIRFLMYCVYVCVVCVFVSMCV